jgi:hypothetical protein
MEEVPMLKKVIIAGVMGGLVLITWMFVVNGILRFNSKIKMKLIPEEQQVYAVLKKHIPSPGRYVCNPEPTKDGFFPEEEPVFSILYGGVGHEYAGKHMLITLAIFFLTPTLAAWLLSQTSERVLSSFSRKLLFFVSIGILNALFGDLTRFGIGDYPIDDALFLALHNVVLWTVVGLVVARKIQP